MYVVHWYLYSQFGIGSLVPLMKIVFIMKFPRKDDALLMVGVHWKLLFTVALCVFHNVSISVYTQKYI